MATEIALEVKVNSGSSVNAVKDLKKEIRDLESLSLQAAEAGDNALARKYSAAAGAAKDKISDLKAEVGALQDAGSKLGTIAKVGATIASGFAAAQGAAALFGSSGKDLEKVLLKVQAASALAQGVQGIATLQEEFGRMKVVAIDAFKGIKAAIGSTGIGLLVVALGTIYAYWDDISAAISGVSEEQTKLNEETNKNLKAEQDKLDAVSSQDNILKLQGKSEKEILEIKAKQTDEVIAASEIQIQNQKDTVAAQVEAAQRNKDILEGLLKFVSLPITAILKGIDLIGAAVGKNFGLEEKFFGGISSLLFDPEATKKEAEKTIAESQKALNKLKNDRAGYSLQIKEINKKEVEDAKTTAEEIKKIREKETDIVKLKPKPVGEAPELITAKSTAQKIVDINIEKDNKITKSKKRSYEEQAKVDQQNFDTSKLALESIGNLSNVLFTAKLAGVKKGSKEEEKILKQQFRTQQKMQIAMALINGAQAVTAILSVPDFTLGVASAIRIAAAGTATLATVAKIASTKFESGSSGGGGGATAPAGGGGGSITSPNTPTIPTFNPQGTIIPQNNNNKNEAVKAYVLEDDVSSTQNRIRDIKTKALYG